MPIMTLLSAKALNTLQPKTSSDPPPCNIEAFPLPPFRAISKISNFTNYAFLRGAVRCTGLTRSATSTQQRAILSMECIRFSTATVDSRFFESTLDGIYNFDEFIIYLDHSI